MVTEHLSMTLYLHFSLLTACGSLAAAEVD